MIVHSKSRILVARRLAIFSVCIVTVLYGCSSVPPRECDCYATAAQDAYEEFRKTKRAVEEGRYDDYLDTDAPYHAISEGRRSGDVERAIRNTHRVGTRQRPGPHYLIAIEKTKKKYVDYSLSCSREQHSEMPGCFFLDESIDSNTKLYEQYRSLLEGQIRRLMTTHIVQFGGQEGDCFLLDSYDKSADDLCRNATVISPADTVEARFAKSWSAMNREGVLDRKLREEILSANPKPTHIILLSTGWNTIQSESIDNYNDWIDGITKAYNRTGASEDFHPIYIGISWPSTWLFPTGKKVSVATKGNDADEAGLVWINLLVNNVLKPIKAEHDVKIVMIGHSYGARVLGHAASSGHILAKQSKVKVDQFIGLQGAFSHYRLMDPSQGKEGAPFQFMRDNVANVTFTTSKYDTAVKGAFWTKYIGGVNPNKLNLSERDYFYAATADSRGSIGVGENYDPEKIQLVEASSIIRCNKPETGGEAHSDVFNPQVMSMIVELIFNTETPGDAPISDCKK